MLSGPTITSCSVRVLRSFDYCHFEVTLGGEGIAISHDDVDALRKRAMRLADKAVEQYKIAKRVAETVESAKQRMSYASSGNIEEISEIEALSETDRTPEQKAKLKHYSDLVFQSRRQYDYKDDWRDEQDREV